MNSVFNTESPDYKERILSLRKAKFLHTVVEKRLMQLLGIATPNFHPVKEVQGLAGGRNDLMLFEFSGKSVVVEVFATASQVSRDLLILHKTKADKKIAIILDKEIDAKIFDKFLKENPDDVFPFLFIREIFEDTPISAYLKLKEIITGDDEAKFRRMLSERLSSENFIEWCQRNGIEVLSPGDLEGGEVTYSKVFVTIALVKLRKQGIPKDKLRKIGVWLSDKRTLEYIFMKVDIGFNMFLYTNLEDHFAVYSDMELTDWIRAGHYFSKPHILGACHPFRENNPLR
jgi:hypothetical protein